MTKKKGHQGPRFGKPREATTIANAIALADELECPVHVTVLKAGAEGDPPQTPCDESDTVGRFLQYWSFQDGKDTAKIRTLRWT